MLSLREEYETDIPDDFFGGEPAKPLCDDCYAKNQDKLANKATSDEIEHFINHRDDNAEDTIFPQ